MALRPLEDIIGPLVVPFRGKDYVLPQVSLEDGLRLHAATYGSEILSVEDTMNIILGDARQAMLDDHVPPSVIDRAFWTGIADFQQGREAAEHVWENGVPKEVVETLLAPIREALTTQQAEESTTPPPASGNGTTAPKKKATRSRGKQSSTTSA